MEKIVTLHVSATCTDSCTLVNDCILHVTHTYTLTRICPHNTHPMLSLACMFAHKHACININPKVTTLMCTVIDIPNIMVVQYNILQLSLVAIYFVFSFIHINDRFSCTLMLALF